MDTDNVSSSRSLSFVSPEALQLNHLVQQSHALSTDSNSIFQLPPGAVPTVETSNVLSVKPSFTQAGLIKPARLVVSNSASDTSSPPSWSPSAVTLASATSSRSLSPQVSTSPFKLYGDSSTPNSQVTAKLPTFLLDEKPDGLVGEGTQQLKSSSTTNKQDVSFSCIVHSTSKTQPIPSPSHTVSSGHDGTTLTSSAHVSPLNISVSPGSTETGQTVASSPIVVLLDPAALQNTEGNEQILKILFDELIKARDH
ncbi:hypothetical protein ElyMa_004086000 [Elysia marginata]|uniref:Uncharacterized protein n=1 Tax=Elysia marginata TaxID=1093978 RepID=A0AAV4GBP8_9GAST|nr:hypothetical protein ElyMa_004086000 [Elysia marginata]